VIGDSIVRRRWERKEEEWASVLNLEVAKLLGADRCGLRLLLRIEIAGSRLGRKSLTDGRALNVTTLEVYCGGESVRR
jgi:hypothetical protein